jgi:hypothetical protein
VNTARILGRPLVWVVFGLLVVGPPVTAQEEADPLDRAVAAAREAWLAHDLNALVASSDTVRLDVPGVAVSASLRPGQAKRLLSQYLEPAREVAFELAGLRRLAEDHAYAEMARRFVVRGTSEEQEEMVFLGFRRIEGVWRLREVRVRR